jgi:oxygen-independent coproporphyrinogen-3 oxidase
LITTLPPLSLYVHLPWCARKCPYCDFNSHQAGDPDQAGYVDALLEDLETDLPLVWGRSIHSIFIGGGTPSLFPPRLIDRLLGGLRARLPVSPACEITLEANPGSADAGHFRGYREAGVNRLSIGIQSFDDDCLRALGRIHDRQQGLDAYAAARVAGFDNINLDLMFALPGQTPAMALTDLQQAIDLGPEHLSHYQLTLEPNTLFHKYPPALPGEEQAAQMQEQGLERLRQAGYAQYEVSAHARPGRASRHNLNYWRFGDYLGIGAGAHGKITLPAEQRILRRVRLRHPDRYLAASGRERIASEQQLEPGDRVFEFMLNALRLTGGCEARLFSERTGLPLPSIKRPLTEAVDRGLLEITDDRIRPTPLGQRFLNDLQALFLDAEPDPTATGQAIPLTRFDT